ATVDKTYSVNNAVFKEKLTSFIPTANICNTVERKTSNATHELLDSDKEILDLIRDNDRPGDRLFFKMFTDGDYSDLTGDKSQSEADYYLISSLTYWCGKDALAKERIFNSSALYRKDKCEKVHSGDGLTYLEMSIAKAISNCDCYRLPLREVLDMLHEGYKQEAPIQSILADLSSLDIPLIDLEKVLNSLRDHFDIKPGILKKELQEKRKQSRQKRRIKQAEQQLSKVSEGKAVIENTPTNLGGMTVQALAACVKSKNDHWGFYNFSGQLAMVTSGKQTGTHSVQRVESSPPETTIVRTYNSESLHIKIEKSAIFTKTGKDGTDRQIPVPSKLPIMMLNYPSPDIPQLLGVVNHPIISPNWQFSKKPGYDPATKLFLSFKEGEFGELKKGDKKKAAKLFQEIATDVFGEFPFGSSQDKAVAVALLLTLLIRKVIDQAPGFIVSANIQGSGKTSLVRFVHLIATGEDMPVSSLSQDSQEQRKAVLALLLESAPLICYDNIPDGFEVKSQVLAQVLTSNSFKERLLGASKQIEAPTSTVFALTGNNISVDADLIRRFYPIYLQPKETMPEKRHFTHNDIVSYCKSIRPQVITKALSIIKMYGDASEPLSSMSPSGFSNWDKLVRFPILWATDIDILKSVDKARGESGDLLARHAAIDALIEHFGMKKEFSAGEVFSQIGNEFEGNNLRDAFLNISTKSVRSIKSLGWALKKLLRFPADKGTLERRIENHSHKWWISPR
nr:hypothetical protein [Bacteroidales bacterium]